ncbi:MAG TPA: hypothetical protein PK674_02740 [Candidatus Absconditabacterales bacterium]|nr:hypothetical protein [Candidatus Absconditabacterales bacterium]HOQ79297.1 hypothetical protein [Candidatus Absconditabacterales bacterium]HPK28325.1 hypothetical protein [Candidatus Absconditabacterales bacterium]
MNFLKSKKNNQYNGYGLFLKKQMFLCKKSKFGIDKEQEMAYT